MEYTKEQQEQISKEIAPLQEAFIVGVIRAADKIGIDRDKLIAGSIAVLAIAAEIGSYKDYTLPPAADVAPVKHGRWIAHGDCGVTECSCCKETVAEYVEDDFCRYCGARMDRDAFEKGM